MPRCRITGLESISTQYDLRTMPRCRITGLESISTQYDLRTMPRCRITGLESISTQYDLRTMPRCRITGLESISIFPARRDTARNDRGNATYCEPSLTRIFSLFFLLSFSLSRYTPRSLPCSTSSGPPILTHAKLSRYVHTLQCKTRTTGFVNVSVCLHVTLTRKKNTSLKGYYTTSACAHWLTPSFDIFPPSLLNSAPDREVHPRWSGEGDQDVGSQTTGLDQLRGSCQSQV